MADEEQQDEQTSVEVEVVEQEPGQAVDETLEVDEANEENEIVLAGEDDAEEKPDPKSNASYILKRVLGREDKLKVENDRLRQEAAAKPVMPTLQSAPDEDAFDTRQDYLVAQSTYQRQMMSEVVGQQLNQQQNGHRLQAQQQRREDSLKTYAETASKLNVSDFNETQDKAFDVLGDDIAQMIAEQLPSDAPKLLYYLGKNSKKAEELREKFAINPGGMTFELGKLAGNLSIKPKRTKAAQPESKVKGGSVGGSGDSWQKQLDKIDDSADFSNMSKSINARRKLMKEAGAAGFDVSTLH